MARLVAAIDLTSQARRVADRARLLADILGLELVLLHVLESAPEALLSAPVTDLIRRSRRGAAEELADWVRSRHEGEVHLQVEKGSPAWEIVRAGKQAMLTVMGTSSVDAVRTGPIARRVAEASWGDVLLVRRQPRVPYRRVVVAVDLSAASANAVELACRIAPGAEITLVFALPTRFDPMMLQGGMFPEEVDSGRRQRLELARERMTAFAERWAPAPRTIVSDGPPAEVVAEVVRRRSGDLTVVASRGAAATRMVLLGSVASGLLDTVPSDLAIARVPAEFRRP